MEEIVLYAAQFEKVKGRLELKRDELKGWVCTFHKQRVEENDGWSDEQRKTRAARTKELKRAQLSLDGEAA